MHKINVANGSLWLLAGILLIGAGVTVAQTELQKEKAENPIKNPGFEEFDGAGNPVVWRWYNNMCASPSEKTYFEVDKKTYAVLPIGKGGNTGKVVNGGDVNGGFFQEGIAVKGDTLYLFSMKHIETENFDQNLYVCVRQYDASTNDITGGEYYFATDVSPATTWKTWSRQFKTKPKTATISIIIHPNGKGAAWFDDFSLKIVEASQPVK